MTDIWIGLDVGTTVIKAAAYLPSGHRIATEDAPSLVTRPHPGWAEQDMADVWNKVEDCLRRLTSSLDGKGYGRGDIVSLGLCAQGDGLWTLDEHRQPTGPAMLWSDTRAGELMRADSAVERNRQVARACHTANWPGTAGSLFDWVAKTDPGRADACRHILFCADWIGLKLTGEIGLDYSNASIPFLDIESRTWSPNVLAAFGMEEPFDRLPQPRRADSVLGYVTAASAQTAGLPEGLPVATGTLDLGAMIVGHAMREPGEALLVLGTTAVLNILTDEIAHSDDVVGATALHPTAESFIRIFAPTTGAGTFDWFTALHPKTLGGDSIEQVARKLNDLVVEVPPGANGVVFLPYLNGERAPFVAPEARGAFHGLSPQTTMAEMGRAVMEGAAFSLRHCFEAEGAKPSGTVQLTGGGSRNTVWCDILAEILGVDILISTEADHGLWGAACIGAAANGRGDACDLAVRNETTRTHVADPARHSAYNKIFGRYLKASEASPAIWAALND